MSNHPRDGLDPKLVDTFLSEVYKLTKKRFGVDEDGDPPLDIHFIDRTKYWPLHYEPVPYDHKAKTQADHDDIMGALTHNLTTALDAMSGHRKRVKLKLSSKKARLLTAQDKV